MSEKLEVGYIKSIFEQSIDLKNRVLNDKILLNKILEVSNVIINSYNENKKVLFCGNGGSAADAQHLAAELSGKFYFDRDSLDAEALHVNTSYITAVANDYSYDKIYSRIVSGRLKKGDVLVGISTSGNSKNIIEAFKIAKHLGAITIGFTGDSGGDMKDSSDFLINIPSKDTPRIQELHILIGHIICELVEECLFNKNE